MLLAKETPLTSFMYLHPLMSKVYLLVNLFPKLYRYITLILHWIALIFGRDEEEDQ